VEQSKGDAKRRRSIGSVGARHAVPGTDGGKAAPIRAACGSAKLEFIEDVYRTRGAIRV